MPFLWRATKKIAKNQVRSGTRVLWKMVPAVGEAWSRHARHCSRRRVRRR